MTITQVIPDFPDAPQRGDSPETFAADADPFVASFQPFVDAINAWAAQVNATNFSMPYKSTDLGGVTPTGPTPSLWFDDTVTPNKAYVWDTASGSYAQFGLVDPATTPNPLIDPTVSTLRMSARSDNSGLSIGTGYVDVHGYADVAIGRDANLGGTGNYNVSVGMHSNENGDGDGRIAIGFAAAANPTNVSQVYSVSIGYQAANAAAPFVSTNLGAYSGFGSTMNYELNAGYYAGSYSEGSHSVNIGTYAGYNARINQNVAIGLYAGHKRGNGAAPDMVQGSDSNSVLLGAYSGYDAEAVSSVDAGHFAAAYSGMYRSVALGEYAASHGAHSSSVAIGHNTLATRATINSTAIGAGATLTESFDVTGLAVTFDPTTQRFTAVGHGLGAADTYRVMQFEAGTAAVPTGADLVTRYAIKIIDADTFELVRRSFETAGSGLLIKVQRVYSNVTLLGSGTIGSADNEVVLGNGQVTTVRSAGDAVFNGTLYTSDRRLKKSVKPIEGAVGMIEKLDFVTFKWDFNSPAMVRAEAYEIEEEVEAAEFEDILDADGDGKITRKEIKAARREKRIVDAQLRVPLRERGKTQIGLIAQNVEDVIPEAVRKIDGIKVVDYAKVAAIYGAAIKEQQVVIAQLMADVAELKQQIGSVKP